MTSKPPLPSVQAFLTCKQIVEDARTKELILIGPANGVVLPHFPARFPLSAFAFLTGGHGSYRLALEMRDADGKTTGRIEFNEPLAYDNPLMVYRIVLHELILEFPKPGRYDLVMRANDEDMAHQVINVTLRPQPQRQINKEGQ
jgi:Family of unknown function (DUF6941)